MVSARMFRFAAALTVIFSAVPSHAGFINHWTFDDADTSGASSLANGTNADTGTISGGVTTGVAGQLGQGYLFNGTTGRVDIAGWTGITGGAARTTSAWVNTTSVASTSVGPGVITWGSGAAAGTWYQGINSDVSGGRVSGAARVSLNGGNVTGTTAVDDGTFHHVVFSMPTGSDGSDIVIYTDGGANTGVVSAVTINTTGVTPVGIGLRADTNDQFFDGTIDDVAVWDEALTTGEVVGLYNVAIENGLAYNADNFNDLKEVHDAMSGTATIGDFRWSYVTGLTGSDGDLTQLGSDFSLLLDASAGTGVFGQFTPPLAPEPSTFVLFAVCATLLAGWMIRRRQAAS